jgi:hypothetical protein
MIIIDEVEYDVPLIALDETCDFLDKYAERTEDGVLHRELIGCYFNQKLQFGSPVGATQRAAMTALWAKLTEATDYHTVTVPDVDGADFTFTAYFASVKRSLKRWDSGRTYWRGMTANFVAQSPAATP